MSMLHKFEPRKRVIDVKRTAPLTHSMEEFFEDFPPRRWMETFEPFGWKWPMGIDFERSFRIDLMDHEKELIVRAELPGVEKDDVEPAIPRSDGLHGFAIGELRAKVRRGLGKPGGQRPHAAFDPPDARGLGLPDQG